MTFSSRALALLTTCLAPALLHAQQTDSTHQLKEVAVRAPRNAREVAPGQKLQAAELQRLNALSVADALRYFSGIQLKDYGGIGGLKTIDVHGMGSQHTGVFYDGIELGNAQNGIIDLGKFSLDNLQEITLYNGQKSSVLQTAKDFASATSIYLNTLKPSFTGDEQRHIRTTLKTGSFGLFNPSLLWQEKVSDKIAATLSTEWINGNGRYKFRYQKDNGYDTTAIRKNGNINAVRAEAGLNGVVDRGEWSAKLYYYNASRGIPGFVVRNVFGHTDHQWDEDIFGQASFRKDVTKHYSLLLNTKYTANYNRFLANDTTQFMTDVHYRQHEFYFSAANQYSINNWWNAGLSADFSWNNLTSNQVDFAYPVRYTTLVAAATSIYRKRFSAQASVLGTFVNETLKVGDASPPRREYTPSLFVSWQPTANANWRVKAFYKRIFRMPTFNDLYYTFLGNTNLKPEYTNQYDAGFTWSKPFTGKALQETGIDLDGAYNTVTNKIVAVPDNNPSRWKMENLGYVKIFTVEIKAHASWQLNALHINTRLTYTFDNAEDHTNQKDLFYKNQIAYIPRHAGSAIITADFRQWTANYSYIYTGERYDEKTNIPANYVQPWYTSDLSLGRALRLQKHRLQLTAQVNNLFNQYYDVVTSYPMPGRNYKLIIALNI